MVLDWLRAFMGIAWERRTGLPLPAVDSRLGAFALEQELQDIVEKLLRTFKQQQGNGVLPHRLIFFRDGVAEGQFAAMHSNEIATVKRACAAIDPCYAPLVSFDLILYSDAVFK